MATEEQARSRVEAFIRDFYAAWKRSGRTSLSGLNPFDLGWNTGTTAADAGRTPKRPDFETWGRELDVLVQQHFSPGSRTGAEGCLSGKPDHDPAAERIVEVEVKSTLAHVDTVFANQAIENRFRYRLILNDGDWRISKIIHTFDLPDAPLIADAELRRVLEGTNSDQTAEPISDTLARGTTELFSDRFNVIPLGKVATSGVLTAHDPGWVRHGVAPFIRRVPPGAYPVEVSKDRDGINVALRMRITEQGIAARIPADRVGSGNVISVDTGNVAILDFRALAGCPEAEIEDIYQTLVSQPESLAETFSLTGAEQEAVVVHSGYGDGAYPAFWGIDADGALVDLIVDFLVAVEEISNTMTVPWQLGPASHPDLARHDFEVIADSEGIRFCYRENAGGAYIRQIRVIGPTGVPIAGREGGLFVQDGRCEQRWFPDEAVPGNAIIEILLSNGYRHI